MKNIIYSLSDPRDGTIRYISGITARELAAEYGVSKTFIGTIVGGRRLGGSVIYGRKDWDETGGPKLDPLEPAFVIRGSDAIGSDAVRAWAYLHRNNGGSDTLYELAMKHANLMEALAKKKKADLGLVPVKEEIEEAE